MAKRKSMGRARATFKLFGGRTQNPVGTATFHGKSYRAANAAGRRYLRNIAAGFYDSEGIFHPIRASHDYQPYRVGERGPRRKAKRKAARRRRRR